MSTKLYKVALLIALLISMISCNWLKTDKETEISDNPNFVSLKFTSTNSQISSASFITFKEDGINDSIIVNLDSLPYKADISKLPSTFSFKSVSTTYLYQTDSVGQIDTLIISESAKADTIDFRWGVKIKNIAQDKKTAVEYTVKINVHTVEPELYQWRRVKDAIYSHAGSEQKALLFKDSILFFVSSGLNVMLYKSPNAVNWSSAESIQDLPASVPLQNMVAFNNKLFCTDLDSTLYESSNGANWNTLSFATQNYFVRNLLFELNNKLWAVAYSKSTGNYHFANSDNGNDWAILNEIPANFPINGFSAISFNTKAQTPKALIVGGYDKNEKIMKNIWTTENGNYWIDLSTETTNLDHLAGASLAHYANKLLMFGRMDNNGQVSKKWYLESIDEGLSWRQTDTTYNQIRERIINLNDTSYRYMEPRFLTNTIVLDKEIVIIGGRNESKFFTDVWIGRLNKLLFIRQ